MAWVQSVVAYALFMRAVAEEKHAAAVKLQARARVRSSKREVDEKTHDELLSKLAAQI